MNLHPWTQNLLTNLTQIPPSLHLQTIYLLLSTCVLAIASTPPSARTLLINYGARKSTTTTTNNNHPPPQNPFTSLIAHLTSLGQVPHSWFSIFYLTSVLSSLFWATQYLTNGSILHFIVSRQAAASPSATLEQVWVTWMMMLLQGLRRIYEHSAVMKPSKSTMWVVHWFLGLFFYILTGIAVWVEGSGKVDTSLYFSEYLQNYVCG